MEAAKEHEGSLLNKILPPRLEDAGLEDCALSPDSIHEAFFKAAIAVKSRATSFLKSDDSDGHCVDDPWPTDADEYTDVVIGISPGSEPPAPCTTEKGANLPEIDRDEVVVGGREERKVKACVDGLKGLEIGEVKRNGGDEEEEAEKPILGLGFA